MHLFLYRAFVHHPREPCCEQCAGKITPSGSFAYSESLSPPLILFAIAHSSSTENAVTKCIGLSNILIAMAASLLAQLEHWCWCHMCELAMRALNTFFFPKRGHFHLPAFSFTLPIKCTVFSLTPLFSFLFLWLCSAGRKPLLLLCGLAPSLCHVAELCYCLLHYLSTSFSVSVVYYWCLAKIRDLQRPCHRPGLLGFFITLHLPSSLFSVFLQCAVSQCMYEKSLVAGLLASRFICNWFMVCGSLFFSPSILSLWYVAPFHCHWALNFGCLPTISCSVFWLFYCFLCCVRCGLTFSFAWGPTHRSHGFHFCLCFLFFFFFLCNKAPLLHARPVFLHPKPLCIPHTFQPSSKCFHKLCCPFSVSFFGRYSASVAQLCSPVQHISVNRNVKVLVGGPA